MISFSGLTTLVFFEQVKSQPIALRFLIWRSRIIQAIGANNNRVQSPATTKFMMLNPYSWLNWNIGWLKNLKFTCNEGFWKSEQTYKIGIETNCIKPKTKPKLSNGNKNITHGAHIRPRPFPIACKTTEAYAVFVFWIAMRIEWLASRVVQQP